MGAKVWRPYALLIHLLVIFAASRVIRCSSFVKPSHTPPDTWQQIERFLGGELCPSTHISVLGSLEKPGSHRQLHFETESEQDLQRRCHATHSSSASHLLLLLEVPPALFLDPFEVANLREFDPGRVPELQLFGRVDLELPEVASEWTFAVAKFPVVAQTEASQPVRFALPMHAKYLTPGYFDNQHLWAGYRNISIPPPQAVVTCVQGREDRQIKPSVDSSSGHCSNDLQCTHAAVRQPEDQHTWDIVWQHPAGNLLSLPIVQAGTILLQVVSTLAVVLSALLS